MRSLRTSCCLRHSREGFTLIELLVLMGLIGVLLSLLIPAVSSARRTATKTQCISNMRQIGIATLAFESAEGGLPHFYFHNQLLPYIGEPALAALVDLNYNITEEEVEMVNATVIPLYQCPSDPAPERIDVLALHYPLTPAGENILAGFNYAPNGNWLLRGFRDKRLHSATLVNGASNAVLISEVLRPDLGFQRLRTVWRIPVDGGVNEAAFYAQCENLPRDPFGAGYRPGSYRGAPWSGMPVLNSLVYHHRLPPNRPNCETVPGKWTVYPSTSAHRGGVQALYADGHVDFISESIDRDVWEQAGVLSRDEVLLTWNGDSFTSATGAF